MEDNSDDELQRSIRKTRDPIAGMFDSIVKTDHPVAAVRPIKTNRVEPSVYRRQCPIDPDMICDVVLDCEDMATAIAHTINDVLSCPDFYEQTVNRLDLETSVIEEILDALEWDPAYDDVLQTCVEKVTKQREDQEGPEPITETSVDEKAIQRVLAIRRCLLQKKINDSENYRFRKTKTKVTPKSRKNIVKATKKLENIPTSLIDVDCKTLLDSERISQTPDPPSLNVPDASSSTSHTPISDLVEIVIPVKNEISIDAPFATNEIPNTISDTNEHIKLEPATPIRKSSRKYKKQLSCTPKTGPIPQSAIQKSSKTKKARRSKLKSQPVVVVSPPQELPANIDYLVEWKRLRSINLNEWDNHLREEFVRIGRNLSSGRRKRERQRRKLTPTITNPGSNSVGPQINTSNANNESLLIEQKPCSSSLALPDNYKKVSVLNMSSLLDTPFKENCQPIPENHVEGAVPKLIPLSHIEEISKRIAHQSKFRPVNDNSSDSGSLSSYSGCVSGVEEMDVEKGPNFAVDSIFNRKLVNDLTTRKSNSPVSVSVPIKCEFDEEELRSNASLAEKIVYDGSSCGGDDFDEMHQKPKTNPKTPKSSNRARKAKSIKQSTKKSKR